MVAGSAGSDFSLSGGLASSLAGDWVAVGGSDERLSGSSMVGGDAVRLVPADARQQHPLSSPEAALGQLGRRLEEGRSEQKLGMRLGSYVLAGREIGSAFQVNGQPQQVLSGDVMAGGFRASSSRVSQLHWPPLRATMRPCVEGAAAPTGGTAGAPLGGCMD
ncbi:hypothetical protein Dimus_022431 [Dionaea muscipula]